ncbi:thioredoxin family protein [Hymenobacter convexus]|uniref:thioredoxin family protein n=1 Tax=Hymenobacter sp. CA1UV-4 TaxID=3063782 RepID=UPI002713F91F|nr:thioredoxin family protein [Hymenobacter sp. CA1UV-4]MDO7854452.1 thioredoxin family protein [Hymenobacter sp. CA1UV-4]
MSSPIVSPTAVPTPAYTYPEFRALVARLAAEHRTTGPDQTPGLIRYTDQNQAHLDRAYAEPLLPELVSALANLPRPEQWLLLAEAWCGDTAHTLPVLAHLAEMSAGRVSLHIVLRSDHPALMAAHQTNGGNSIPKLIRRDAATGADLGDWGPRPAAAQVLAHQLHADKSLHVNQIIKEMNAWYEADNGEALQRELLALLG